jgi:hypothetical protein
MSDVYAKLDWATERHADMERVFEAFAKPGGGDDRPYGIRFRERNKPKGLVVAFFIVEEQMPMEMSLLAADVVHNTRVALDHVLARLKDRFGGDPGSGSFPTCQTEEAWLEKLLNKGKRRSALQGLDASAIELIYEEQPLHSERPVEDPLVILNKLDNDDKHRLLHPAFVYTEVDQGIDLIEVLDGKAVKNQRNLWTPGDQLVDGTDLALFMVSGEGANLLQVRTDAAIGFASGEVGAPATTYSEMIVRVRGIVDKASALIDS